MQYYSKEIPVFIQRQINTTIKSVSPPDKKHVEYKCNPYDIQHSILWLPLEHLVNAE